LRFVQQRSLADQPHFISNSQKKDWSTLTSLYLDSRTDEADAGETAIFIG
jgi:hypothetical protein